MTNALHYYIAIFVYAKVKTFVALIFLLTFVLLKNDPMLKGSGH